MEKFKASEFEGKGVKYTFTSWRFTQGEKSDLEQSLAKFPPDKVAQFIDDLEMICLHAKSYLLERDVTFQRAERKRMLNRLKKATEELEMVLDKKIPIAPKNNIFDESIYSDSTEVLEKESLRWLMISASMQMKKISEIIQDTHNTPGRPSTNTATGDLVKVLAVGFKNYFETPTGYQTSPQNPGSGPFFSIVQIVLAALDLPCHDPSRHIRAALEAL